MLHSTQILYFFYSSPAHYSNSHVSMGIHMNCHNGDEDQPAVIPTRTRDITCSVFIGYHKSDCHCGVLLRHSVGGYEVVGSNHNLFANHFYHIEVTHIRLLTLHISIQIFILMILAHGVCMTRG